MPTEQELFEIGERMGEAAHVAWMERRKMEKGWHAPEDCPLFERDCSACGGTMVTGKGPLHRM
jgi:hydrogenase maturation factor